MILRFPVNCLAYYDTELEIPDGMSVEEAYEYAMEKLPDLVIQELNWVGDEDDNPIDRDMFEYEFGWQSKQSK